ncbi:LutC/YkgG family protein [Rhizohabitans arisaemae]|uniref:LutC/YkgG family protein n=1 Tax=Rhizohabitans arisaemae TaxID=2720610 RepID=UPI0024B22FD2|nr:LUD domain-containing protein [Rhizohabitans arisaemae]
MGARGPGTAREEILARIAAAAVPPARAPRPQAAIREGSTVMLAERIAEYRATVVECTDADLADVLAELLAETVHLVVPSGLPPEWLDRCSMDAVADSPKHPLTAAELDRPGTSVLTGCAVAIARTGTVVLDGGPGQGRRLLTLVPDHHICLVRPGQTVDDVPDALAALPDPARPLTFVSGPSATSDIELRRIEGVHGPRRLNVVIMGDR